jgi:AAHS family 4-hydroxybenzoate transporter-like MFS transporter
MKAEEMQTKTTVNVSQLIDNQHIGPVTFLVCTLCFLGQMADGYDLGVVGLAAPGIIKEFHLGHGQIAPAFSAAIFGMLFGAIGAGYLGDRLGRKLGIVLAQVTFCIGSLLSARAGSVDQLIVFRLITGLGLGGMLPNIAAMMVEYTPLKIRATLTTISFMGITFGGLIPGQIGSILPDASWRTLFYIGALIPAILVPILLLFLPESVKYLAITGKSPAKLAAILGRMARDRSISAASTFVLNEHRPSTGGIASLFEGRLKLMTPLLWIVFMAIMFVNFYVNSWLAVGLRAIGFPGGEAAATTSLYYLGGVCGGLSMGVALDIWGPIGLVGNTVLGAVAAILMSIPGLDHTVIKVLVYAYGFSILGSQVGYSSLAGLMYPTASRSRGAGFAQGIGRLGGFLGPLAVGALSVAHVDFQSIFGLAAVPLAIASLATLTLIRIWSGHLMGFRLRDLDQDDSKPKRLAV